MIPFFPLVDGDRLISLQAGLKLEPTAHSRSWSPIQPAWEDTQVETLLNQVREWPRAVGCSFSRLRFGREVLGSSLLVLLVDLAREEGRWKGSVGLGLINSQRQNYGF